MSGITIHTLSARPVLAPLANPPVTASGSIDRAPLVLLDLATNAGITGHSYLFTFSADMLGPTVSCCAAVAEAVSGQAADPATLDPLLRGRYRLFDTHGILGQVLSGIDMAVWDIAAKSADTTLAALLGADIDRVPAYNSCGLWVRSPQEAAAEVPGLLEQGHCRALKMRLGRADPAEDLAAIHAVRSALPDDIALMSDYNQSACHLPQADAATRCRMLDDAGLDWIEEPVDFDDFASAAALRGTLNTPLQLGENLRSPREMEHAIAAGAADYYMPDVQRIGGVSGWLAAARLAASHELPLSSHLFPEVSVQLLAASPTRHWLEYVDWANAILAEPLALSDGAAVLPQRPGNGLAWDEAAVSRYAA